MTGWGEATYGLLSVATLMASEGANRLEEFRPFFYEEPVPPQNLEALKKVADNVNIPIATGERLLTKFDFADLLPLHAVDLIQPDVVQAGGYS